MRATWWLTLLLASCSGADPAPPEVGDSSAPADTGEATPPGTPFDFVADVGPTFVDDAAVGADGLLLDRIVVLLANDADAAGFEAALAVVGGQVASSLAGFPWLTVSVPPVADLAGAQAVADALAAQAGIRRARPAWRTAPPELSFPPSAPLRAAPVGLEGTSQQALGLQRFYAAWNAAPLARRKAPVWVADFFTKNEPLGQLSVQRFVGAAPPAIELPGEDGVFAGNHGFWVTSLLAADADERVPLGTHPAPATTLDVASINIRRLGDGVDLVLHLGRHLPLSEFFVLSTSFGFVASVPAVPRAETALAWRELLASRGDRFLHLTSAGNEGLADPRATELNSAFTLQAAADDLRTLLSGSDRDDFADAWEDAAGRTGARTTRVLGHTLTVGASGEDGTESSFSNRGAPVRMVGESLMGVCERRDPSCVDSPFGRLMIANGTSGSTPMAAGLAAWMWAIDPSLDAAALRDRLLAAYDGRWIDALDATLALESPTIRVREALLDYFPGDGFDENDITAVLAEIDLGDEAGEGALRTWPKGDLNGDGQARRESRGPFDLDGDGVLGQVVVRVPGVEAAAFEELEIDEAEASDLEILCWGAYAGPYTGDADARDAQLREPCQPAFGFSGTIVSTTEEVCTFGKRTTTHTVRVTLDEEGAVVSVDGTSSLVGTFSNVTPGDCVLHEDLGGPFVLEGDGATSSNSEGEAGAGALSLVYLRSGTRSYTGLDDCPDARFEDEEAWVENFRYQRAPNGTYDFTRDELFPGDCTLTIKVRGTLR